MTGRHVDEGRMGSNEIDSALYMSVSRTEVRGGEDHQGLTTRSTTSPETVKSTSSCPVALGKCGGQCASMAWMYEWP